MSELTTASYETSATVTNVVDDLVSTGIPREKIHIIDSTHQVQVLSPGSARPEIMEILKRHQPLALQAESSLQ